MDVESDAMDRISSPRGVLISFVIMAVCFSLNHGTVSACIPLASGAFGDELGSYSLGTLYLFYTVTALGLSTAIVKALGQKWALVTGLGIYCVYVLSYFVAREVPSARWYVVEFGSACGGVAAGFLWTAQGGYFSRCAKAYAAAAQGSVEAATAKLSGIFATVYLGFEVVLKLLSSLVIVIACGDAFDGDILTGSCSDAERKNSGEVLVYAIFALVAVASTVGMVFIELVPEPGQALSNPLLAGGKAPGLAARADEDSAEGDGNGNGNGNEGGGRGSVATEGVCCAGVRGARLLDRAVDALRLLLTNRKMQLMAFTNVSFGFLAAFLNSYVTGDVIEDGKVGYYVAIIPLVATAMSIPFGYVAERTGRKAYTMLFGSLCFLAFIVAFASVADPARDLRPAAALGPLFVAYGMGRAMWEGPNKAVFADFFADAPEPAFANLILQNGGASTVAFFAFPNLSVRAKEIICICFAAIAVPAYIAADRIHRDEQTRRAASQLTRSGTAARV